MSANSLTFAVEKEKSIVVMEGEASKKEIKRIPYGMMNFVAVREDNYYYVDKTRFIEKVENANRFFFFFRPRRFGKSLTMSMLRHYYDVNQENKFERLYGDLYIGHHPTPNHNKYLIIYLNFAVIHADLGSYRSAMDAHCNTRFNSFCDIYASLLPAGTKEELNKKNGCVEQLDYLYDVCYKADLRIYLFIDEYGHFTNHILADAARLTEYKQETHGTGYLRTFFDTIKAGTDSSIERVFVTGVSPVALDNQGGYADIFLRPRQEVFTDMEHSYIIELKYLKSHATDMEAEAAVKQARAQVLRYADTVNVGENIGHTTLHKVIVVYRGVDMVMCEDV